MDNDLIKNYSITTNLSKDLVYYYELSKLFAKDKHNLILVSRNKNKLQSLARSVSLAEFFCIYL